MKRLRTLFSALSLMLMAPAPWAMQGVNLAATACGMKIPVARLSYSQLSAAIERFMGGRDKVPGLMGLWKVAASQ